MVFGENMHWELINMMRSGLSDNHFCVLLRRSAIFVAMRRLGLMYSKYVLRKAVRTTPGHCAHTAMVTP